MALLTIPSITKGTAASVSLNKTELFTLSAVAADEYFSDSSNVKRCVIELNSDPGGQRKILQFDLSQATPTASVLISLTGRDSFLLERLVLEDFDGGLIILERSQLPSGLDVSLVPVVVLPELLSVVGNTLSLKYNSQTFTFSGTTTNGNDAILVAGNGQLVASLSGGTTIRFRRYKASGNWAWGSTPAGLVTGPFQDLGEITLTVEQWKNEPMYSYAKSVIARIGGAVYTYGYIESEFQIV